ncbi:MAG: hypothetical protein KAG97_06860 [Victivallales bacterium]|nr:hypothetical protein [Victivallales bacterium]
MNVKFKDIELQFDSETDCLPTRILLDGRTAVESPSVPFSVRLGDGRLARPFRMDGCEPMKTVQDELCKLTFHKLLWQDESGELIDDFFMSLVYEIWDDGAIFVDTFFFAENTSAPDLVDFKLELSLNMDEAENLRWGFIDRPASSDFAMIQSSTQERFLEAGTARVFENKIVPIFTFDGKGDDLPGVHYELFVEGHSTLSGERDPVATEVSWKNGSPTVSWNFQTEMASCGERPWQWRNRWGMLLASAPTRRNLPPLRMYHYFDNYKRYPSTEQVARIADSGADVLILHENWRMDTQNGGIPYDYQEFNRVVSESHARSMRVAAYIRGNEDSAYSDSCSWFDELLLKNSDGLYMDYGGPIHVIETAEEIYPGGRMMFRQHHQNIRDLRKRIGKDGVFFSHTGPCFSALGMTNGGVDGYVSGEGERGIMLENRDFHEYFSVAYAANGSMWTAAFPEYGSAKMVPYLGATGQYPHTPLGIQFSNSSLAHPRDPGVNDVYLRPLWKLWGLFKDERDIAIFNDYNCKGVFKKKESDTGGYLMVAEDGQTALLIISNFKEERSSARLDIDWTATGFAIEKPLECMLFQPKSDAPGKPTDCALPLDGFSVKLEGYGVAGWLLSTEKDALTRQLEAFANPYPARIAKNEEYLKNIEIQKQLRCSPPITGTQFLKIEIDNLPTPYEESLWWDLYDNAFQIGTFDTENEFKPVGWITTKGFCAEPPKKNEYILPGHQSPWIPLEDVLGSGNHKVGIRSIHMGAPFYSFIKANLATEPNDGADSYEIKFSNEIEGDRSFLKFNVNLDMDDLGRR